MKIVLHVLAALMMAFSLTAAGAQDRYHPVARIQTDAGYSLTAVQRAHKDRKACLAANKAFVDALKAGCPKCRVRSSDCKTKLDAAEADAINGKAVKSYSVSSPGLRLILTGQPEAARRACEEIAAQESVKGKARCLRPGQAA